MKHIDNKRHLLDIQSENLAAIVGEVPYFVNKLLVVDDLLRQALRDLPRNGHILVDEETLAIKTTREIILNAISEELKHSFETV